MRKKKSNFRGTLKEETDGQTTNFGTDLFVAKVLSGWSKSYRLNLLVHFLNENNTKTESLT